MSEAGTILPTAARTFGLDALAPSLPQVRGRAGRAPGGTALRCCHPSGAPVGAPTLCPHPLSHPVAHAPSNPPF
jgi:hypothetical protein